MEDQIISYSNEMTLYQLKQDASCTVHKKGTWVLIYTICCMHRLKKSPYGMGNQALWCVVNKCGNTVSLSLIEAGITILLPYCFLYKPLKLLWTGSPDSYT